MDAIVRFKRSFADLQKFHQAWLPKMTERCADGGQRLAGYYLWARYSMSVRTLDALNDLQLLPDAAVICRGCLEFGVSLVGVLQSGDLAREYLEFDKHAKARYLKLLGQHGEIDRLLEFRGRFDEQFGEEPESFKMKSWCDRHGGATGLMKRFGGKHEQRLYNILSHFAHGSVSSLLALNQWSENPALSLAKMLEWTYSAYLTASYKFLEFIWGPLVTPDGEGCKRDFVQVMSAHLGRS